jgi:glycosyltransferase involved in cell wall biosynthesis
MSISLLKTHKDSLPVDLTVLILTFNEERHLERCLNSLRGIAKRVVVVDSNSADATCTIAERFGADVYRNPWINYAYQFNWGLDNTEINTNWVMRLDADEVLESSLCTWIQQELDGLSGTTHGLTVNRQIHFMGQWIRRGDIYPRRMLRIWRTGLGRCEERWMDEHITVAGKVEHAPHDIADINLNNITWWINKHNHYASREAIDTIINERRLGIAGGQGSQSGQIMGHQARLNRWFKSTIYARTPMGLRAILYFAYRYLFRLGFLDGWRGLIFHSLQGLWYRFLVDVKVWELKRLMRERAAPFSVVVKSEYGYTVAD